MRFWLRGFVEAFRSLDWWAVYLCMTLLFLGGVVGFIIGRMI